MRNLFYYWVIFQINLFDNIHFVGHYRHIVYVQISKKKIMPLTHGRYEVNKIIHWDQTHGFMWVIPQKIYFQRIFFTFFHFQLFSGDTWTFSRATASLQSQFCSAIIRNASPSSQMSDVFRSRSQHESQLNNVNFCCIRSENDTQLGGRLWERGERRFGETHFARHLTARKTKKWYEKYGLSILCGFICAQQ